MRAPSRYGRDISEVYDRGRRLDDHTRAVWMAAVARHVPRPSGIQIIDVGCGTGRFSTLLAETFGARVLGVDPSDEMLAEAARAHPHPRVTYRAGVAEALPAPDAAFDVAFLAWVIHHLADLDAAAGELRRVLAPGGRALVVNTFSGRLDDTPLYHYFPGARGLDEARLPTLARVQSAFTGQRLDLVATERLVQQTDPSLRAHAERLAQRAVSTLRLIAEADFERGLARLRLAAEAEREPLPVHEPLDLLVWSRPR